MAKLIEKQLVYDVFGCALEAYKEFGYGFLELVYEKALLLELHEKGIPALEQMKIPVSYKGTEIAHYAGDIVISNRLIIELKAADAWHPRWEAQLLNYLKATGYKVGMIIWFGPEKVSFKRMVF